jgi:DNA-directed RNA polymerase
MGKIITLPTKLPMIVSPKPYSKNIQGGYLLNNDQFSEDLFIEKKGYGVKSQLSDNTYIYDMINKINNTPFKINTVLLDYITNN